MNIPIKRYNKVVPLFICYLRKYFSNIIFLIFLLESLLRWWNMYIGKWCGGNNWGRLHLSRVLWCYNTHRYWRWFKHEAYLHWERTIENSSLWVKYNHYGWMRLICGVIIKGLDRWVKGGREGGWKYDKAEKITIFLITSKHSDQT